MVLESSGGKSRETCVDTYAAVVERFDLPRNALAGDASALTLPAIRVRFFLVKTRNPFSFMIWTTAVVCVLFPALAANASTAPLVLDPAVVIDPPAKDGVKSEIHYLGQPPKAGRIDLTATNGFFSEGFKAEEQKPMLPGDERFIRCSFGSLVARAAHGGGTARWHLWCPTAGEIHAACVLKVSANQAGHTLVIKVGDDEKSLSLNQSDGESPQAQSLSFNLKSAGEITFSIDCTNNPLPPETRICYITLQGPAITSASLLRVRWRPSAVHQHFVPEGDCPSPRIWVFETRSDTQTTSYSPITTPFGYFGTTFDGNGKVEKEASFNFSMWIAGRTAVDAPPIDRLPCLIGTSLPKAQYSSFGGEGTGIKFRDAVAYPDGADAIIQAMRVETRDGARTFFGYFYDEREHHWKLFASAQERTKQTGIGSPGSFCEIPGPPDVQRTGDVLREIKRRGWFQGSDLKWYPAVLPKAKRGTPDPDAADTDEQVKGASAAIAFTACRTSARKGGLRWPPVESPTTPRTIAKMPPRTRMHGSCPSIWPRKRSRNCLNCPSSLATQPCRQFRQAARRSIIRSLKPVPIPRPFSTTALSTV